VCCVYIEIEILSILSYTYVVYLSLEQYIMTFKSSKWQRWWDTKPKRRGTQMNNNIDATIMRWLTLIKCLACWFAINWDELCLFIYWKNLVIYKLLRIFKLKWLRQELNGFNFSHFYISNESKMWCLLSISGVCVQQHRTHLMQLSHTTNIYCI
jgi:hypothetical protein